MSGISVLLGSAKWDAYAASIDAEPADLRSFVDRVLPEAWGGPVECEARNGRRSFSHMIAWKPQGGGPDLAWLQWGGVNSAAHLEFEGMHSPRLVQGLRLRYPVHRVSRCDAAIDLRGPDVFPSLWSIFECLGHENTKLDASFYVNTDPDKGNSYYLGAKSSAVRCVLYEKGKQMAGKTGDRGWLVVYSDVARVEARVRPPSSAKGRFATLQPSELFGASLWLRKLADRCFGLNAEPVQMKPSRTTDHDRAMAALTTQYSATLLRDLAMKGGDIEAWASELIDRCTQAQESRGRDWVLHASPH